MAYCICLRFFCHAALRGADCGATAAHKLDTHNSLMQGQIESNYDETVDNFDSMDLKPELLRGKQIQSFFFFFLRHGVHYAALSQNCQGVF